MPVSLSAELKRHKRFLRRLRKHHKNIAGCNMVMNEQESRDAIEKGPLRKISRKMEAIHNQTNQVR